MISDETTVFKDYLTDGICQLMADYIRDELEVPSELPSAFYYRKANIQKLPEIISFSEKYIKPLLENEDAILIGDTIFCTNIPHAPHTDCRDYRAEPEKHGNIKSWKSVLVPLEIDTEDFPSFYTSEQLYDYGTTTFRRECESYDLNHPETQRKLDNGIKFIYDYSEIDNIKSVEEGLSEEWYKDNFDFWSEPNLEDLNSYYFPYSMFKGLTIENEIQWKPGNIVVFDSFRIHFGQNIAKKGATYKIGLNLNYGLPI